MQRNLSSPKDERSTGNERKIGCITEPGFLLFEGIVGALGNLEGAHTLSNDAHDCHVSRFGCISPLIKRKQMTARTGRKLPNSDGACNRLRPDTSRTVTPY